MSLQETIWAQSAEALGIPVLLRREPDGGRAEEPNVGAAGPVEVWSHEDYVRQSVEGAALLAGSRSVSADHHGRVLALNFHDIGVDHRDLVADQLRQLAVLGPSALDDGVEHGLSVLAVFYDGYRDAGLYGAELCVGLGLTALFLPIFDHDEPARAQLDDADLADLARVHRLGYHTHSHRSGVEISGEAAMAQEVAGPMERLTAAAGTAPVIGAYCGGGRFDPGREPDRELRRLGVRHWLSNWSFEQVPAEDGPAS